MASMARIVNDTAVDVIKGRPEGRFTAQLAAEFVDVPDGVENGWLLVNGVWTPPPAKPPAPPLDKGPVAVIGVMLKFSAAERMAMRAPPAPVADAVEDVRLLLHDPRLVEIGRAEWRVLIETLRQAGIVSDARALLLAEV